MSLNPTVAAVLERIGARSRDSRREYLGRMAAQAAISRRGLSCANLAHAIAAAPAPDKARLREGGGGNIAIVSAYNEMLSAHTPLEEYPQLIRRIAREYGCTAQFAGGVPAMCDGVTQGQPGMEMSLFSRDVIALATIIALSHNVFDAALCLGVCDKIVPGLVIGALSFGHLPILLVPGGPMPSGLPNRDKSRVRKAHAAGKASEAELLAAEEASYHGPGTCTFYGTANSNQVLMEAMGLHAPGAAFVPTRTALRTALTEAAAARVAAMSAGLEQRVTMAEVVDERAIVNAMCALLATGGSTNHTIHLVAMARAAGLVIDWEDFAALSAVVPLLARVYPNGHADVNDFERAGGTAFVIRELLAAGLMDGSATTMWGTGLAAYARRPQLSGGRLEWVEAPVHSGDREVLRGCAEPFSPDGGLKLLRGNLGRSIIKVSSLQPSQLRLEAPAAVFAGQTEFLTAFRSGSLERDFVAVITGQGPAANGMPELHSLTPALGVLQDRGFRVALVTDGRMSGASGNVPAAIHLVPESVAGGAIGRLRDGDLITLDAVAGVLSAHVTPAEFAARPALAPRSEAADATLGRHAFQAFRGAVTAADLGACTLFPLAPPPEATSP